MDSLYLLIVYWASGDPGVKTDQKAAGRAALIMGAWWFPAIMVIVVGQWIKTTFQIEDPVGAIGAIVAGSLFWLVWFGGTRLTVGWLRRRGS